MGRDRARRAAGARALLASALGSAVLVTLAVGCDAPETSVVLENRYPAATIYLAGWQAVCFSRPVLPGASSDPQTTVSASDNTVYALLAPGGLPEDGGVPAALVVLQSQGGFAVHLGDTLHIPVDDDTFAGDCAAGRPLSQAQADIVTRFVFPSVFAALQYDAATCTTTAASDAASPCPSCPCQPAGSP